MLGMNSWSTHDHRVLISFAETVTAVFQRHIQARPWDREAGGLLLGTVHGANILVVEATVPTRWDRRFRYMFERMWFGHRSIAQNRWKVSGGTVRYVGEWHTHPQDVPRPSGLDSTEWKKLARNRADGRPVLAVIVGRRELYVELISPLGNSQIMLPMQ